MTEINIYDAQYKNNDLSTWMTASPFWYVGGGPHAEGYSKMVNDKRSTPVMNSDLRENIQNIFWDPLHREYCTFYPKISMFCTLSQNDLHLKK